MTKRITLIHYQPIERYPPVMNTIRHFGHHDILPHVISTPYAKNWFTNKNVAIDRLGYAKLDKSFKRYSTYILFNIVALYKLILKRPSDIIAYETYSLWPVHFYLKLYKKANLFIHYHEFSSDQEKEKASNYLTYLYKIEAKLLHKAKWISHTNEDRLSLFKRQHPKVSVEKMKIIPNYPLLNWVNGTQKKEKNTTSICRLIYVGSVGLDSTHLKKINEWIDSEYGKKILDIYSDNIDTKALNFLKEHSPKYINVYDGVKYYDLPGTLNKYDAGVVLYNGYIPNHVYCVPNKVVEYLHCGLDVWYSKSLLTTTSWAHDCGILSDANLPLNFNKLEASKFHKNQFSAESALNELTTTILNT